MATAISRTTTRNIAYNAIKSQDVKRLPTDSYSLEEYLRFDKKILAASQAVPTSLDGGKHGHAFLVQDAEGYKQLTGTDIIQDKIDHPGGVPSIDAKDSHATIALKTAEKLAELDTYYTQEGVEAGLRDLIIKNVPKSTIEELEDSRFGFSKVTPLELLQHLKQEAEIVDAIDITTMLTDRDTPIDFEGEETLKTHLIKINKTIRRNNSDATHDPIDLLLILTSFEVTLAIRHESC